MKGSAYPDFERLLGFLEGPSSGVNDEAIAIHVEGCAVCRAELERLAAATATSRTPSRFDRSQFAG